MKKKILFVIESLNLGGAEKSLVTLLNNLNYDLISVDLMLFYRNGIFEKYCPPEVKIVDGPKVRRTIFDRILFELYKLFNFKKLHNAQLFWRIVGNKYKVFPVKYDVAIAYSQGFASYFVSEYITAEKKFSWLNIDYRIAGYKIAFDYRLYSAFTKIVAVSDSVKLILQEELNKIIKTLDIEIVRDIVDEKIIYMQADEEYINCFKTGINIVSVGRLVKQKAFSLAIEVCSELKQNNIYVNWFILGEGRERKNLENLIKTNNLQDTFFLLGATDNPYPYINACDIYVQTSLFEGLGISLIEAAFLNKPIVTTNFPTAYTIIEHEKTGLICEMNANAIAKSIERLIKDENLSNYFVNNLQTKDKSIDKVESINEVNKLLEIQ